MNAAEHKTRAEELLAKVETPGPGASMKALGLVAQIALVHATLATIPDTVTGIPNIPPDPNCECGHDLGMWHGSGGCVHGWDAPRALGCYCEVTS